MTAMLSRAGTFLRVAVLFGILWLIHDRARWDAAQEAGSRQAAIDLERIRQIFPEAGEVGPWNPETGGRTVSDEFGFKLGYVIQTSPASDSVLGYSGPTNVLIGFDTDNKVTGVIVLSSGDTKEHVDAVLKDTKFLASFRGKSWDELQNPTGVDGVSGATLTSIAIVEGIAKRLGGNKPSLRFPKPIELAEAQKFFPEATALQSAVDRPATIYVLDQKQRRIGSIIRTSPFGDEIVGYQGPTDTLVALDLQGNLLGFEVHDTFETEKYVDSIRDDDYFRHCLDGRSFASLATLDLEEAGVEGVSGATMTSFAMAKAMMKASADLAELEKSKPQQAGFQLQPREWGTIAVVVAALLAAFSRLRGKPWLRVVFQLAVIGYLGFVTGDFVSQAVLTGWARHGVPWQSVPGLVVLTAAAFLVPVLTRRQVYCHQICPHGAVQQLIKNRLPWKLHIHRRVHAVLSMVPGILIGVSIVAAMMALNFNLANLEPFDAYVFWIAGWGSIGIALAGLLFSLFVPMGYCRYGCPTGAVLSYVRHHSQAHRFTRQDAFALCLLITAFALWLR